MSEGKRQYKRRTILIRRSFQIKHALITLALFALSAFIVWWELYESFSEMSARGLISDPQVMLIVREISSVIMIKMSVALLLVWLLSILLTHFVAGPLYRLEKGLEALRDGDFKHRIHLRKWDELESLAQLFNEAMDRLQKRDR